MVQGSQNTLFYLHYWLERSDYDLSTLHKKYFRGQCETNVRTFGIQSTSGVGNLSSVFPVDGVCVY